MSILPKDDKARKGLPLLKQIGYFPKALREITKVSVVNNVRYNPDRDPFDINWARGKSTDQAGSGFRHVFEHEFGGQVFDEVPAEIAKVTGIPRVYVLAEAAWRALAALEIEIEKVEAQEAEIEVEEFVFGKPQEEKKFAPVVAPPDISHPELKCVFSGPIHTARDAVLYRKPSAHHSMFTVGGVEQCRYCGEYNPEGYGPLSFVQRELNLRAQGY